MSLGSVVRNVRKNGFKYFTPKRIFIYLRSLARKSTKLKIDEKDVISFSEIIMYKSLTCSDCVELGHCKICECPINELFSAMEVGCSEGKFPNFKTKDKSEIERWKEFKKENNIQFIKFED